MIGGEILAAGKQHEISSTRAHTAPPYGRLPARLSQGGSTPLHLASYMCKAEVARLLTLGAGRVDIGQRDVSWVVLADPEGNEFCVLSGHSRS